MSKYTTPAARIAELVAKYGSYRKVAKATGVSATHLRQVSSGERHMRPEMAQSIGLIAETKYRRWGA